MNDETIQQWVRRSRAGEAAAFARLYEAHVRRIYDFIYFKTYHRETAEDLTAAVFLKAMEGLERFDPDQGSFTAWLYRIAGNSVIDFYRTHHPTLPLDDVWDVPDEVDVAVDAVNRERFIALRTALRALPAAKRDLVILRVWQDLPFAEIAAVTGGNEAQCRVAFHRLLEQLRRELPVTLFVLLLLARHAVS